MRRNCEKLLIKCWSVVLLIRKLGLKDCRVVVVSMDIVCNLLYI